MSPTIWRDGFDLAAAFRCMREVQPHRVGGIRASCKRSRRFRRWLLKELRQNPAFVIGKMMGSFG